MYKTTLPTGHRLFTSLASILTVGVLAAGFLLSNNVFGKTPAASSETVKLRVKPADAAKFKGVGTLVADYGGYQVYEAAGVPPTLDAGAFELEPRGEILLNSGTLNTKRETPGRKETEKSAVPSGKRSHLVQFVGPVKPEWVEQLKRAGLRVISYVPENAYLVYGDNGAIKNLQDLSETAAHIGWEGGYDRDKKIHKQVKEKLQLQLAEGTAAIEEAAYAIQLIKDPEGNSATLQLIDQLKRAPVERQEDVLEYINVVARFTSADVSLLAERPDVVSINTYDPRGKFCERQAQIVAGNLNGNHPLGPGYLAWLRSKGFDQSQFTSSGFAVDVSDSGLDDGTLSPNHYGLYTLGSFNNPSRVAYNRLEGRPNSGSTLAGCDGHGTLNTHILAGYDDHSGFPFTDSSGFRYGLGVCPFVRVGSSVIFDPENFTNPSFKNLQSRAYQGGARISNNSWGGGDTGAYDIDCQQFDALVRDAQPNGSAVPKAGNQEMIIVVAAGNKGPSLRSVGSPGTAKNVITVGAGESVQTIGGVDASGVSDSQANSANDIVAFSSRGPCSDGRHKPDLMAPGTHVSGGVYQRLNPGGVGTAAACFSGTGVSGGPGSSFFPSGQEFFTASSGTSHAAPAVSGGAALLRQYFINKSMSPPSPAMTKAYLMNAARYMTGASAKDTLWSDSQGMGQLNLGNAFDDVPRVLRDQSHADLFTASGQTRSFSGNVADATKPFRVTLAWTDAPGTTAGNSYNNNLDLVVTVGGATYKGNVFSGAGSIPGGSADPKNNVETVALPAGVTGPYTVQVIAANINSDGVPQNGIPLDQDFALVVYNANLDAKPVIAAAGSALVGESFTANGAVDPGETVTFDFKLQNNGTAPTTNLVARLLTSTGVSSPSAEQTFGVVVAGAPAVQKTFSFRADGTCGTALIVQLELTDGAASLGTLPYNMMLGRFVANTSFAENFDEVVPPALPSAWTTSVSGSADPWITAGAPSDSVPNSAQVAEPESPGVSELVSPGIPVASAAAQLSFRSSYDLESDNEDLTLAYDGGVLEMKVGGGAFRDILEAGGMFMTGGYTHNLDAGGDNPLAGRKVWAGASGGFTTTLVALPSSVAGQTVQFRWRFGTDSGNFYGGTGWKIDTVSVLDGSYDCVKQSIAPTLLNVVAKESVRFSFQSLAGQRYFVEFADTPDSSNWQTLQSFAGNGAIINVTDSLSAQQRFYRIRSE